MEENNLGKKKVISVEERGSNNAQRQIDSSGIDSAMKHVL
jgi:hypothetical protein